MYLPVLAVLAMSLFCVPVWTHRIFAEAYAWESAQIAMDNAAIVMGKADTELIRSVGRANQLLNSLEISHHALHLCARSVGATPHCLKLDSLAEAKIASIQRSIRVWAEARWRTTLIEAQAASPGARWTREGEAPLRARRCPACNLEVGFEMKGRSHPYAVETLSPVPLQTSGELFGDGLLPENRWHYRLTVGAE